MDLLGCNEMTKKSTLGLILIILLGAVGSFFLFPQDNTTRLLGAGATFPYPLISVWIDEFHKQYPNITINYQPIGSGGGIRAIMEKVVDFAGSDVPLDKEEFSIVTKKGTILHIPETLGAVVVVYNIPELNGRLKLTGEVLVDIYLGKISKWNDPKIAEINPDLNLPDKDIIVVKRSDGSGTTYIFTDYLSSVSEEWRNAVGKTKIFEFPEEIGERRGISAKGNQGVTQAVQQNPYSIGYIELSFAMHVNIPIALIRNRDGFFVEANLTTVSEAAAGAAITLPEPWESWENVSIVNAPGRLSYPISSFSYFLVYAEQSSYKKCLALKKWFLWAITEGQKYADELYYAPLPEEVIQHNMKAIEKIHYVGGQAESSNVMCLNEPLPILTYRGYLFFDLESIEII